MKTEMIKELSPVEFLLEKYKSQNTLLFAEDWQQAKEMQKDPIGYTESDMRNYASFILTSPVIIEPSRWYKIFRNKTK